MTQNTLSVLVNTSASNIARITQRKNVEVHMLYKISKALKHNFFKHFPVVEEEQPAEKDKVVEELNAKIASLEKQAQSDNIEIRILKQENEYLKEINDLMKITLRPTLVRLRSGQPRRKSVGSGSDGRLMIGEGK
jgi:transcriptional regulator with XRE-family HTH domain